MGGSPRKLGDQTLMQVWPMWRKEGRKEGWVGRKVGYIPIYIYIGIYPILVQCQEIFSEVDWGSS